MEYQKNLNRLKEIAQKNGFTLNADEKYLEKENKNILILCQKIAHGELLQSLIPNSVFLHGSHSSKQRESHLTKVREGTPCFSILSIKCLIISFLSSLFTIKVS